jgi:hypothetical protein
MSADANADVPIGRGIRTGIVLPQIYRADILEKSDYNTMQIGQSRVRCRTLRGGHVTRVCDHHSQDAAQEDERAKNYVGHDRVP